MGVLNWRLPFLNHNNMQCMRLTDWASNLFFQSNKAFPAFTAGKCEIWLKVFQGVIQSCYFESQKTYGSCSPVHFAWGKSEWLKHLVSSKLWFWRPPQCPCLILHYLVEACSNRLAFSQTSKQCLKINTFRTTSAMACEKSHLKNSHFKYTKYLQTWEKKEHVSL